MTRLPKKALLTISALTLAMSASFGALAESVKSVAVTAIVEHPALDSARDGVLQALNEAGYTQGENLKWQYPRAQGYAITAAPIATKSRCNHAYAFVSTSSPSAHAAVSGN